MENLNVFSGENAVRDFLNPANHTTPLVELNRDLNPFFKDNVHIFIKLQTFLPLMNVKSIPAHQMLNNNTKKKKNIIESSSGNMAFSLSILSKIFGYNKMRAIVSNETGIGKLQMLLLSGAEICINKESICPNPNDIESGIKLAQETGKKKNWQNLNQYQNPNNPLGHYNNCGQELLKQMQNDIQIFCNCLGTTGSMCGIAKALKSKISPLCIGVVRKPNNPVPGPRTLSQLKMIGFNWQQHLDYLVDEGTEQAYLQSLKMCRNGLLVGPSSGLNLAGLLKFLRRQKQKGHLEELRNKKGQINCIILGCDLPFPYMDEYFKYLPQKNFGKIIHSEWLSQKINFAKKKKTNISIFPSILLKKVFKRNKKQLWKIIQCQNDNFQVDDNIKLVDLRNNTAFTNSHIPSSINIEEKNFLIYFEKNEASLQNQQIFLICDAGEISYMIAKLLQEKGFESFSLVGGFIKWSELNYPRISNNCQISAP